MTSPRDEIGKWLDTEVNPLYPRAGSLERIRGRARKRKRRQAITTAAGCAVVLAAAVTVPQIVSGAQQPGKSGNLASPGHRASIRSGQPTAAKERAPSSNTRSVAGGGTQIRQRTYLTPGNSGTTPPVHFRPTSVTVVGAGTAANPRFVGAVIGQAGPPCYNPRYCTSMAGTSNYGASWYGVSAPAATGPRGATGVSQLRFTNLHDGWAFGPALYETSGGGWPWTPENTYGQRVIDIEATGQSALAIFASCGGTGPDYASHCTSFSLYRTTAGSTTWTQLAAPLAFLRLPTGQASSASLVISGGTKGYLLTPSGAVLSGPVSGRSWSKVGQAPCQPGGAQASGAPADAQLAAGPTQLVLACDGQPGPGQVALYTSQNGASWQRQGMVPENGTATSIASATAGQIVLATTTGIYYQAKLRVAGNGSRSADWIAGSFRGGAPAGGFSYVGMTSAAQGVAVPADAGLGEIFVTTNGGRTWTASPVR